MKFAGICLITEDVTRLSKFYQNILNVKAIGDDVHVELEVAGNSLAIYSKKAAINDMNFDFGMYDGNGKTVLMFCVDDVDREYERIKEKVGKFITAPKTYPWGARAVHFWDPDGNIVDFYSPPERK